MQLEWSYEIALFTLIKHRINNTGWTMKWWWREGWNEVQTPVLRECWTFLIYIFLHQKRKQCLEFALPKPGEICKHLACAYNSNSHACGLHYPTFVCGKQAEKSTQWGQITSDCWPTIPNPSHPLPPHAQGLRLLLIPRPLSPSCLSLRTWPYRGVS